jgi:hypothetical protein
LISSNGVTTPDKRIWIQANGIDAGGPVLITNLEDTLTSGGDFLVCAVDSAWYRRDTNF